MTTTTARATDLTRDQLVAMHPYVVDIPDGKLAAVIGQHPAAHVLLHLREGPRVERVDAGAHPAERVGRADHGLGLDVQH